MTKFSTPMPTVGLDVSEKYLHSCEISVDGEIDGTSRFRNTAAKLTERFGNLEPRRIIVEVGSHSRWIAELLTSFGHEVLVVDPRRLKLISGTLYKDDKLDAEMLAQLGWEVPHRLKTIEPRRKADQKALTMARNRATVVEVRTKLVNAIRGTLKPFGVRIPKSGRSSTFVAYVREQVDPELVELVEPSLLLLESMNRSVAAYDKQVEALLPKLAPDALHLTKIPGVGALTVLYFVALVGDPSRFAKSRNIGAYFGLCRRRDDSGDYTSALGITKAGDRYMRALLGNCATHILGNFGKDSDLRRWGLRRQGGGSRAEKRKAKVAVARKLAVLMLTLWRTGDQYEPFHHSATLADAA